MSSAPLPVYRHNTAPFAGNLVALLAEDEGSIGKAIGRQLLRTRRNFTATVFSPDGAHAVWTCGGEAGYRG